MSPSLVNWLSVINRIEMAPTLIKVDLGWDKYNWVLHCGRAVEHAEQVTEQEKKNPLLPHLSG